MAEVEAVETEEEGVVKFEEKYQPATEETHVSVFYTTRGKQEDESDSVTQPLLQHKHQGGRDENRKAADTQTAADGADRKTSVPQELELAGGDEPGCSGSVRSLCSDSSRHDCPICSEPFDSRGEHRIASLNCNHALCHRCVDGIMRRAKDQSRLLCPFCRQTTPFPQWEIRRLQEESYSNSVYEPAPVISPGPEPQAGSASSPFCCFAVNTHTDTCGCCVYPPCRVRPNSLCCSVTVLLLLILLMMGCFLL